MQGTSDSNHVEAFEIPQCQLFTFGILIIQASWIMLGEAAAFAELAIVPPQGIEGTEINRF